MFVKHFVHNSVIVQYFVVLMPHHQSVLVYYELWTRAIIYVVVGNGPKW